MVLGTGSQDITSQVLDHSQSRERHRISMLATIKQMSSLVTERLHSSRPDLWIEIGRLKGRDPVGIHYKSALTNDEDGGTIGVLCEVKTYGSERLEESIRRQLPLRREGTAVLLRHTGAGCFDGFRVLNCLGYFHDPARLSCGLVYRLPTTSGSSPPQVSMLRTLLANKRGPSLGSRFRLAQKLATAVLEFHKVAWLHKSISSLNIAFVYPKDSSWRHSIGAPYLLGFSNSRPDEEEPFSNWLNEHNRALIESQHPEYLKHKGKVRYRPEFDYFSLGMVLLEIGHWKPLDKIITITHGSPEDLLNHLRQEKVPGLGFAMGTIYRDVVDTCLKGDFGNFDDTGGRFDSATSITLGFAQTVVEQLAKCWA